MVKKCMWSSSISTRPNRRTRMAFTLVEMLVVIAIIGVLISLVVPGLQRAQQQTRVVNCASNLRQIHITIRPYIDQNGVFPRLFNRSTRDQDMPALDTVFAGESGGTHIYRCPADTSGLYEKSGTSYYWNFLANGQLLERVFLLGQYLSPQHLPLVADKENFHPTLKDKVNILYADGHISEGLIDYFAAP